MVHINVIKIDHDRIQHAIRSAVASSRWWGDNPEFIVMSANTQALLKKEIAGSCPCFLGDTAAGLDIDYSAEYMGIPIAINNSLGLGEVKIV